jgi:hypothetical protein
MGELTVSLEEGFARDRVVIRSDGATAYDESDLTTQTQTGLAGVARVKAAGQARLEISLPARGLTQVVQLNAAITPYVRVSIVGDRIELISTDQAPYYA